MNKMKYFLVILAAVASGFVSSLITVRLFTPYKAVTEDIDKGNTQKTERKNPNKMNVIEANQFRLVDLEGNSLAKLTIEEDQSISELDLLYPAQIQKAPKRYHAVLEMGTGSGMTRITKNNVEIRAGSNQASLASGSLTIKDKSSIYMYVDHISKGGTAIEIYDEKMNSRAVLGSVNLNVIDTGEIRKRPESSLVLFGRDGKVVYSAPPGR